MLQQHFKSQGLVTSLGHPWDGPRDLAWFCTVPGTIRSVQKIPNTDIWFEFRVKSPDRTKIRSKWVKIGIYCDWDLGLGLGQFSLGLSLGQKIQKCVSQYNLTYGNAFSPWRYSWVNDNRCRTTDPIVIFQVMLW